MENCFLCGMEINETDIFCPNCRTQLKKKCPTCGNLNTNRDIYCRGCGNVLTEPEINNRTLKPIEYSYENKNATNSASYMLFGLGALLLIIGLFLATYTTTQIVYTAVNYGIGSVDVPHPEQVQPYVGLGVLVIIGAVVSIGLAFSQLKKGSITESIKKAYEV